MEISLDQILALVIIVGVLSAVVSYFVSWMVTHDAIDNERQLQERRRLREERAEWEKTHIPDEVDILYRRR